MIWTQENFCSGFQNVYGIVSQYGYKGVLTTMKSKTLLNSPPEEGKDEHDDHHHHHHEHEHDDEEEESNYDYNFRPRKKNKRSGRQLHSVKIAQAIVQVLFQALFRVFFPLLLEVFSPLIWLLK